MVTATDEAELARQMERAEAENAEVAGDSAEEDEDQGNNEFCIAQYMLHKACKHRYELTSRMYSSMHNICYAEFIVPYTGTVNDMIALPKRTCRLHLVNLILNMTTNCDSIHLF